MNELAPVAVVAIPRSSDRQIAALRRYEEKARLLPQEDLQLTHVLHAGLYARTMLVRQGMLVTGVVVKVPTVLIVSGDVLVTIGDSEERITGYTVLPAAAHRKQAFLGLRDTLVTMTVPTSARTVAEAEAECTDELDELQSRRTV